MTENQNNNTELVVQGAGEVSDAVNAMSKMESLEALTPQYSLVQEYLKLKEGERVRGVFAGITQVEFTDEESGESRSVDAARIVSLEPDGAKKLKIHAGANLVSNLKRSGIPAGTAIEIYFRESKKEGKKTLNIFDVYALS
jgi:hypothetical protein